MGLTDHQDHEVRSVDLEMREVNVSGDRFLYEEIVETFNKNIDRFFGWQKRSFMRKHCIDVIRVSLSQFVQSASCCLGSFKKRIVPLTSISKQLFVNCDFGFSFHLFSLT